MNYRNLRVFFLILLIISMLYGTNPVLAEDIPEEAFIDGFIGYAQQHTLTCEARSAADLAGFWGITITEDQMFDKFPKSENPEVGFVGNPDDYWGNIPPYSYGIHATPVAKVLRKLGLAAKKGRNLEWDTLRSEIAAGHPVIVWIVGQMWAGEPVLYTTSDGSQTLTARFEHTMVLTGYTASQVQVLDSYSGFSLTYSLASFLQSWKVLGNQAVIVQGYKCLDCGSGTSTSTPIPDETLTTQEPIPDPAIITPTLIADLNQGEKVPKNYTVQRGEYLIMLAKRFGLDWRRLAELNNLTDPWVIHPGQVIILR
jgi:uncharacterized protein YvpB